MNTERFITLPARCKVDVLPLAEKLRERRLQRAKTLDRIADAELSLGRHGQAERLAHAAAALREAVR